MAYDEGLAELLRNDLMDLGGITEKRMFGGLCFMWNGNMLCGVHKGGGMFRMGKERHPEALKIEGAEPMGFTGRPMGGMIDLSDEAMVDDTRRGACLRLAMDFVGGLPAK